MLESVRRIITHEPELIVQFLRIATLLYRENGPQEVVFRGVTYNRNQEIFTDQEFDDFKKQTHFQEPKLNAQNRAKVKQQFAFGTLEKFTESTLDKYKRRLSKIFGENNKFILTPKYDGIGMRVYYGQICLTRYDKDYGLDISYKCQKLLSKYKIPKNCVLRGELMTFREHDGFSSKRNYVSGMVNNELQFPDDIEFVVYEYLELNNKGELVPLSYLQMLENIYKCGFMKHLTQTVTLKELSPQLLLEFKNKIEKHILTDGVVIRPNNKAYSFENIECPKYQIGYKFQGERVKNTVESITWTMKQHGYLMPTINLSQVTQIDKFKIQKATGNNFNYLYQQNIVPGAECYVSLKIVPRIEGPCNQKLSEKEYAKLIKPKCCPYCQGEVLIDENSVYRFYCSRYYNYCWKYVIFPKAKKYLKMTGCGDKTIKQLIEDDCSFSDFIDGYKLTKKLLFLILSDNVSEKTLDQKYSIDDLRYLIQLYGLKYRV